jgi:hypothetical protein
VKASSMNYLRDAEMILFLPIEISPVNRKSDRTEAHSSYSGMKQIMVKLAED